MTSGPEYFDTLKTVVIMLKFEEKKDYHSDMPSKEPDSFANNVDPDQTAAVGISPYF